MPRKLIDEPAVRLVEVEIGEGVEHVLEVKDGVDAMGAERWRKMEFPPAAKGMSLLMRLLLDTIYKLEELHVVGAGTGGGVGPNSSGQGDGGPIAGDSRAVDHAQGDVGCPVRRDGASRQRQPATR